MTLITFRKTVESTMRRDSISATGSRCSPRDLTPTDRHSSRSRRPRLHRSLLFNKSIFMSTLRTQHASHGEGPNSYMWLQRKAVWLICIKANFV